MGDVKNVMAVRITWLKHLDRNLKYELNSDSVIFCRVIARLNEDTLGEGLGPDWGDYLCLLKERSWSNKLMMSYFYSYNIDDCSKCCVCKQEASKAHKCASCLHIVHAICGEGTEEGYGASVICNNCKTTQTSKHMTLIMYIWSLKSY